MEGAAMSEDGIPCTYCNGVRLVGWSGAGPLLCPECSYGQDACVVITRAWREQRKRVRELEGRNESLHRMCADAHDHNVKLKDRLSTLHDALALAEIEVCLERSWCRICRTEGRGDRRGRDVHPHAPGCHLEGKGFV